MANQTELYKQYYDVYRNEQNHSIPEATAMALNQSVSEATGAAACTVNTYAGGTVSARCITFYLRRCFSFPVVVLTNRSLSESRIAAWFWFTIMTTIGYVRKRALEVLPFYGMYALIFVRLVSLAFSPQFFATTTKQGDQIVETANGRVMVFTIGFLSILAFGGILVTAGFVVTTIFDDALVRFRLRRLTVPWVACFFWGSLYYGWMCGIAQVCPTGAHLFGCFLLHWLSNSKSMFWSGV